MIDFPSSPVAGQTYTYGSRTWIWSGAAWKRQISSGQMFAAFVSGGVEVKLSLTALPYITNTWTSLVYV